MEKQLTVRLTDHRHHNFHVSHVRKKQTKRMMSLRISQRLLQVRIPRPHMRIGFEMHAQQHTIRIRVSEKSPIVATLMQQ